MRNRSNKAFTLIELLAVIVILAIILLIATPIILNVIKDAKVGAFKNSIGNIVRTAELTYAGEILNKGESGRLEFYYTDGKETSNKVDVKLDYKGKKPDSGYVFINNKGEVEVVLYDKENKLCGVKTYTSDKVELTESISKEECVENVSKPRIELIIEQNLNLEIELGSTYEVSKEDVVAYKLNGEVTDNIKIYIDGIEKTTIDRGVLNKEYEIIYRVIEEDLFSEVKRTIKIVDTTKPVLTIPENEVLEIEEVDDYDLMDGVSVTDNSGEILAIEVEGSLSKIAGNYTITYRATDSSGNKAEETRVIDVKDINAPVITLIGEETININVGETYVDQGATAIDDADGEITDKIITENTVNTNTAGTYYVTYRVKDSSNNESSKTRTIKVKDNVVPTVAFGTNGNAIYARTRNTTVIVSDVHGTVTNRYYQWTTNMIEPMSSSFIQTFENGGTINTPAEVTGGYYLWIKGVDNSNNEVITRSNVFNLDNTRPDISNLVLDFVDITQTSFRLVMSGDVVDNHSGVKPNNYFAILHRSGDLSHGYFEIVIDLYGLNHNRTIDYLEPRKPYDYYYINGAICDNANNCVLIDKEVYTLHNEITDTRDDKKYKTIEIDGNTWFAENLMYTQNCLSNQWSGTQYNACRLNGNSEGTILHSEYPAVLYQYNAAASACPSGWRLPTYEELDTLWDNHYYLFKYGIFRADILNTGFDAIPGGSMDRNGNLDSVGEVAEYWVTEYSLPTFPIGSISMSEWGGGSGSASKGEGYAIRCIKE